MSGLRLHRIVIEFSRLPPRSEALEEALSKVLCPHPHDAEHRCPQRWMMMSGDPPDPPDFVTAS